MKLSFTTLDVFTTTPYQGNPLAIIEVPHSAKETLTQAQKLAIAKEFNLSETVFLHLPAPPSDSTTPPQQDREINIFTTHEEIPFAGHPTIGTAHYLLNIAKQQDDHAHAHAKSNVTSVVAKAGRIPIAQDAETGDIKVAVPQAFHAHAATFPSTLNARDNALVSIVKGMSFICAGLPDLPTLAQATSSLAADSFELSRLDEGWRTGMIGTIFFVAQGSDDVGRRRYRTRMQAWIEDPGTGSASCALACYLALLEEEGGKGPFKYVFEQGVEMGRRNLIGVEVERTEDGRGIEKVVLSGTAVKVMEGSLEV